MNKNMLIVNLIRFIVFFGSLLLFINVMNAQRVYVTDNRFEADYTVFVGDVEDRPRADWIVHFTENEFDVGGGVFCLMDNPYEADFTIYIITNPYEADKILCYRDDRFNLKFDEE